MPQGNLKQFYIPEEQSIYLLSHQDAQKLKDWFALCQAQLEQLGYRQIEMIGSGAFGFVFAGLNRENSAHVFKFSRITLPQHVQDRLEEEAFMLSQVDHPLVPRLVQFQRIGKQSILVMERAAGQDLEQISLAQGRLSPRLVVHIAAQLAEILNGLRGKASRAGRPIVHGDIKPSNLVLDPQSELIRLIDWGSAVFAQLDHNQQYISHNVMELMGDQLQQTNARLGDVYFIGEDQLGGALSSPRFDEQGAAATLYALASGQSCRFGRKAIPANALGLPIEFARVLDGLLSEDPQTRLQAGDYWLRQMPMMARTVMIDLPEKEELPLIPIWSRPLDREIDTVVYSSRKSFLKEEGARPEVQYLDDVQFARYYKNYLEGMGETEKAFLSAVGRLGKYPLVGGLVVRWEADGVYIDSSLNLHDPTLRKPLVHSINNMIHIARTMHRQGLFKSCLFNARDTLHLERDDPNQPFQPHPSMRIPYEVSAAPDLEDESRVHSYFEDGKDPDEFLELPVQIMDALEELNRIHHTGLIIFECLQTHLKIHSYYRLLDPSQESRFRNCLDRMLQQVPRIQGLGISGYMKLPYKDTKFFPHTERLPERYYPKNPRALTEKERQS